MDPAAETRDRLLDAGTKAFVAKSYNACGLNEVLCAAGVPKGSFYHYFKSKEDFGVAVIEASADESVAVLKEYLTDRSKSPMARLRAYYEAARDCCATHGARRECLITNLALETSQLSEPMRAAVKCGYDQWVAVIAKTIREAQVAGEIDPQENPEQLADLLINAWEGATLRMQIDATVEPLNQFIEYILNRLPTPK